MQFSDFRIGWRLLRAEPAYSAVVVAGLAVGFAACFLLLGFVQYSLHYNSDVPDSAHVFAVKQKVNLFPRPEWDPNAPIALRDVLRKSGLPLTVAVAKSMDLAVRVGDRLFPLSVRLADREYAPMFGLQTLEGDMERALTRPDSIALTQAAARKLFGDVHALGKRLSINGKAFSVDAILRDLPANSNFGFDALAGTASSAWPGYAKAVESWNKAGLYVRLGRGASEDAVLQAVRAAYARSPAETWLPASVRRRLGGALSTEFRMVSLNDLYFDPDLLNSRAGAQYGNRDAVMGMAAIGLLVLLLACINYVNLATVRTLRRQREIGVRKALGASAWRIAGQFVAESLVVALLATALGLLLAWLLLPLFADLVDRELEGFFTPLRLVASFALGALVGVAAALYPAWIALRIRAGESLLGRGTGEAPRGMWIRRALTVFQFAVAMSLSGSALAVAWQTHFASNAAPGFDPAPLLVFNLPERGDAAAARSLRERLLHLPGVDGVCAISEAIGRDDNKLIGFMRGRRGEGQGLELKFVSPEFFDVYRVGPVAGRVFHASLDQPDSKKIVVNASAAIALGFDSPQAAVGQPTQDGDTVIGIAPDLRFNTMRQVPQPLVYGVRSNQEVITVRVSGDQPAVAAAIAALWRQSFPNDILDLHAARDLFAPNYKSDRRLALALGLSSMIATALAAFGIYVLSAYQVQRRTREIVLRKLYGAGPRAIARLMGREFAALVAIGALAGLPLAGIAIARYLAGFVERAPMGAWPLAAAFGFAALVALAACARHTRAAMRIAPARALRD